MPQHISFVFLSQGWHIFAMDVAAAGQDAMSGRKRKMESLPRLSHIHSKQHAHM